ncbi:MBL fold metallo-hydrolase [Stappia stellulata]|uniref:MBL fold metallo-hydrolase n=1 Tax=Stappia stellulata TaxID=71235 RepID=UPI000405C0E9|nr:MBL fold metallo-hydrolase [Stappia stellulata]
MIITSLGHSSFLVETGGTTLAVDPWLTPRLDRFWRRNLHCDITLTLPRVDALLISHHHCDHLNVESLAGINKDAIVLYPDAEKLPVHSGSGMGYKAIPWILRELGFTRLVAVKPLQEVGFRDMTITALPSKVMFPEFLYLLEVEGKRAIFGGDAILHPRTEAFFRERQPAIDIAFIPSHSTSPAAPLLERREADDYALFEKRCRDAFSAHTDLFNATLTVPSSFGWRVDGIDAADRFAWVNRKIFPFTPLQAHDALKHTGRRSHLPGSGDRFVVSAGGSVAVEPGARHAPADVADSYADLVLEPKVGIPAFRPGSYGEAPFTGDPEELVRKVLAHIVGTYYWSRHCTTPRPVTLRLSDGDGFDTDYALDIAGGTFTAQPADGRPAGGYSWLHPSTLKGLFDAELLFANAFGLWASNDNLLTEIFHHPSFFMTHLGRRSHVASPPATCNDAGTRAPAEREMSA